MQFAVFDDADGDVEEAVNAICTVIDGADGDALRDLGFREIDDSRLHGDWYDAKKDSLLKLGNWRGTQGEFVNPRLRDLDSLKLSGAAWIPKAGTGGQSAYAFANTPYELRATPAEVQEHFAKVRHIILSQIILSQRLPHTIRDWASPDLVKVSPIFKQGMEWWGVFLFTIYVPDWRRHTVIVGSTTD